MRRDIVLPPEKQPVPLTCPLCAATVCATHNPNTGALETLSCSACSWVQDIRHATREAKREHAALLRKARKNPPKQLRFLE